MPKDTPAAPPAPFVARGFTFGDGLAVPEIARAGKVGANSPAFPVDELGLPGSGRSTFLIPVAVAEGEDFKKAARKTSNRLSGGMKKFKRNNPTWAFAIRTVNSAELGVGVRIWRLADIEAPVAVPAVPAVPVAAAPPPPPPPPPPAA